MNQQTREETRVGKWEYLSQGNGNGDELSMDVAQGGNNSYLYFAMVLVFR